MITVIVSPAEDLENDEAIAEAAALVRAGRLVAFPTETVYGLGADATNAAAVELIFDAKGRPSDNPVIVHIADIAMLDKVVDSHDPRVVALGERFWPGPLTLVLKARPAVHATSRGLDTVGVRMPDHPVALALIRAAGVPIAAPSANRSGKPSTTTAHHVWEDLNGRIPLILDGGPCQIGIESTVLDLSGPEPQILRPGAVSAAQIAEVLGTPLVEPSEDALVKSPGTLHPHYRPTAPVIVIAPAVSDKAAVALIERIHRFIDEDDVIGYITIGTRPEPGLARAPFLEVVPAGHGLARDLYGLLRDLDSRKVAVILVDGPDPAEAVWDRLRRASWRVVASDAEVEDFSQGWSLP